MNVEICLKVLRHANARLASFFDRFCGVPVVVSDQEVVALAQLERALRSVGDLLDQGVQQDKNPQVRDELSRYAENLRRLRYELASRQTLALECRERLSARQQHLHAAQAWCETSQATQ